ncbi:hypothetical protein BDY21DRAFT_344429 [Lineolata rhizophorae]|uniref:Uncharacterized protein n=1 Tax=Lineolata rhizophorae TaxID=578093 RepID=A0A6A6P1F6_9PEZI|nr:hypothetical protein BDY21DRAFT_344429 [Lineolata rhizophorae]
MDFWLQPLQVSCRFPSLSGDTGNDVPEDALADIVEQRSVIAAWQLIAFGYDEAHAESMCDYFSSALYDGFNEAGFAGAAMKFSICSMKGMVMPVETVRDGMQVQVADLFAREFVNASRDPEFHQYYCENVCVDCIDAVGLDGQLTKNLFCEVLQERAEY